MARPVDAGGGATAPVTAIANLDGTARAHVDPHGTVLVPAGWSLGWWVRSAERWHVPAAERSTTQRLVDGAPVVETSLRVPDGWVRHRAWCTRQGEAESAVVELENDSAAPVAVALAVRPGPSPIGRIALESGIVHVDGRPSLALPRTPSRVAAPVADVVLADGGDERWGGDTVDRDGRAEAAFVFPLAHTARLRVAIPLGGGSASVDLAALPDADRVANGWRAHTGPAGSLRLELPDERVAEAVTAGRAALLVAHDRLAVDDALPVLAALDRHGLHARVATVLAGYPALARLDGSWRGAHGDATAAAVWSLGDHWRLARDVELAEVTMGAAAKGAHRLARRRGRARAGTLGPAAQRAAADLLDGAGQPDAAERCRELATRSGFAADASRQVPWPVTDPAALRERLDRATPTWSWPGEDQVAAAAALLLAVRELLVREAGHRDAPELALAPSWPDDWLGQGVEVHDAPTWWGRLSYAVRWHGARPALLWELLPHPGVRLPVTLSTPGLDPSWRSTDVRGEALLAPVEPAGGLPGVVRPLPGDGLPAASAPEGGTFT